MEDHISGFEEASPHSPTYDLQPLQLSHSPMYTPSLSYIMSSQRLAPTTSPPTFSSLPTEILLNIFEHCPNLPTAASLARTCTTLNEVWNQYTPTICGHIFMRTTKHYLRVWAFACGFNAKESFLPPGRKQLRFANEPDFVRPFLAYLYFFRTLL
ncbi:MAG: hypothetical protein Q9221_009016 [Calogaya cf. arnoldii]